jgi:hypothetical protein
MQLTAKEEGKLEEAVSEERSFEEISRMQKKECYLGRKRGTAAIDELR